LKLSDGITELTEFWGKGFAQRTKRGRQRGKWDGINVILGIGRRREEISTGFTGLL
jgi:hypothetical protein